MTRRLHLQPDQAPGARQRARVAAPAATLPLIASAIAVALGVALVALPVPARADVPGADQYAVHCIACHGAVLEGVEGLGLNLATSKFVASKSVPGLVAFLKAGRLADAADSVSGRPMPGFFWLAEDDLQQIAALLKSRRGG